MNLTWEQLKKDMNSCEQTPGQTIYQHGASVWWSYKWNIDEVLAYGCDDERSQITMAKNGWKYPSWFKDYDWDLAWERLSSSHVLWYTTYHDCGKPYCLEVSDDGGRHFPNHAEISHQVWTELNYLHPVKIKDSDVNLMSDEKVRTIGNLIRRDMEIHTIKARDLDKFCENKSEAVTLLLVGLAEIHSNAEMFGGIDSPSFKIKWKQIDRRGRAICKKLFGEKPKNNC